MASGHSEYILLKTEEGSAIAWKKQITYPCLILVCVHWLDLKSAEPFYGCKSLYSPDSTVRLQCFQDMQGLRRMSRTWVGSVIRAHYSGIYHINVWNGPALSAGWRNTLSLIIAVPLVFVAFAVSI